MRACGGRGGGHHALLGALCSRSLAAVRLPYPPGRPCMYHVAPQCPPITRLVSRRTQVLPDHRNRLNCAARHMRPAAARLALIMSGLAHSTSLLSQRPTQAAHRLDRAQARGPSWRLLAAVWGRNGRSDPVGCGLPATAALLWPACRDLCLAAHCSLSTWALLQRPHRCSRPVQSDGSRGCPKVLELLFVALGGCGNVGVTVVRFEWSTGLEFPTVSSISSASFRCQLNRWR